MNRRHDDVMPNQYRRASDIRTLKCRERMVSIVAFSVFLLTITLLPIFDSRSDDCPRVPDEKTQESD